MFDLDQTPLLPESAIEGLVESRYGFSLVDVGITPQDLADFDQIAIASKQDYNRCGELDKLEGETAVFLSEIGNNDPQIIRRVAYRIGQIAKQILAASKRDTAWVWLHAYTSVDAIDRLRWHFDWPYYSSEEIQYRFVMTLKGFPTLFYLLPLEDIELRRKICKRPNDYDFVAELCEPDRVFIPNREVGVVFMNRKRGALHSEPSNFDQSRLFFSIVPCSQEQVRQIELRVKEVFHKK